MRGRDHRPVLSWLHSPLEDCGAALLAGVDLSVSSREHLRAVAAGAAELGVPAEVRAEVSIAGHRFPVAGRIAMDQVVVDVGDAAVRVGDEVVVFGPGTEGEPTVADWARWAGIVAHEVLTGIGPRVQRRHG